MERPNVTTTCIRADVFSDANARAFTRDGYLLAHDALVEGIADRMLSDFEDQKYLKVEIDGGRKGVTTFYSKNGPRLFEASSLVEPLEQDMVALASHFADTQYVPLDNRSIGASVNVTPPGGGFQTHFDRQEVSAVVYLNEVEGGELDVWPRLRRWERVRPGYTAQRMTIALTMVLPPVRLRPRKGSILLFTRESPHRVAKVRGDRSRVSVVFGLDRPGHTFLDGSAYYGNAEETVQVGSLR